MKIQWLYYFSVLADLLNLSSAAESLSINMKTLQNNIKQLESRLGVSLFTHQYSELTEAGVDFQTQAFKLLISLEKINMVAHKAYFPEIKIGWSDLWGQVLLPQLVTAIEPLKKQIKAQSFRRNWYLLLNALKSQFLDIALMTVSINDHPIHPDVLPPGFELYCGPEVPYQIVGSPKNQGRSWDELQFVDFDSSLQTQSSISIWNDDAYPRQIELTLPNTNIVKKLCQRSDYAAYLPALLTEKELASGSLVVVAAPPEPHIIRGGLICSSEASQTFDISAICRKLKFERCDSYVRH